MKKIIERSLPLNVEYTIVDTWYCSIEDGGNICQNCGALISNCAQVESIYGKFTVGMDCAATLSGVKDSLYYMQHESAFNQAKSARAKILKAIKDGATDIQIKTFTDANNFYKEIGSGLWSYTVKQGGSNWKQYPASTWKIVEQYLQSTLNHKG